jgi:hypothetical protein
MKSLFLSAALILTASQSIALEVTPAMVDYARAQFQEWVQVPEVVAAVRTQNEVSQSYTDTQIQELDAQWQSEIGQPDQAMISGVLSNLISQHLARKAESTDGRVSEVFVMDMRGLNVAQSTITSDFWQGDEAKYQKTYLVGAQAMHVSDIELDESTQTYQTQISVSLVDTQTGEVIGAATLAINTAAF